MILSRAQEVGLDSELARHVGNAALWYYNRILLLLVPKDALVRELPFSTNRYLVPITLAMGCEFKGHPVELDRLLHLSGTPTKKTVQSAHYLYSRYRQMLSPRNRAVAPRPSATAPFQRKEELGRPAPSTSPPTRAATTNRPKPVHRGPMSSPRAAPSARHAAPVTALATPLPEEIRQLHELFAGAPTPGAASSSPPKPRQIATNAWARKRIASVCHHQGIPGTVSARALAFYEKIVDLHSVKGHAPAGKRLQLSPRLNWSLVYTTIYLGCRAEEFPRDLRTILGPNARHGSIREIYRLYRFYKRELGLEIHLVDVKTFIQSWLDGFELSDLMQEEFASHETRHVRDKAIAIADRARSDASLRRTSTKLIAAGALTTVLAERRPPGSLSAFYRAIASFLHMSEEMIRAIVARIAQIP
ncbi:MAG: hypothetical protein ACREDK_02280 [Thermoplasmata archaeon]